VLDAGIRTDRTRAAYDPAMNDHDLNAQLLAAARAGDLEAVMNLAVRDDDDDGFESSASAYKWLAVAADFGHDEADDMIDDLLTGPLHHDDDGFVSGHAHFELAVSYLTGNDGLPVDFDRAREHVREMLIRGYPASVQGGDEMLIDARRAMNPEAATFWDAALAQPVDDEDE
jgi:hypothetical protein